MQWRPNDLASVRARITILVQRLARLPDRRRSSDALFCLMMTTAWIAGNVLALLGCFVVAFIVVAHGDLAVFMAHADNLASRYLAADAARRAAFVQDLRAAFVLCALVLFAIRLPRFLNRLRLELAQEKSRDR